MIFKLLIFLLLPVLSFAQINIIYDIDFTLTHEVMEGTENSFQLKFDKKFYRVNDWALEGIEELVSKKNVNIFFFSGGKEVRNIELLKNIKLPESKKSLLDISKRVYSFKDLEQVSNEGHFTDRYKKNLESLGFDMDKTLLIEDNANFVPEPQKKNVLYIGKTYHHYDSFEVSRNVYTSGLDISQYAPHEFDQWFIAKNKFKFVNDLVLDAIEKGGEKRFLKYIYQSRYSYIPYDEELTPHYKSRYGNLNATPSSCYRQFKLFKLN